MWEMIFLALLIYETDEIVSYKIFQVTSTVYY